jgi:hypothetical protein
MDVVLWPPREVSHSHTATRITISAFFVQNILSHVKIKHLLLNSLLWTNMQCEFLFLISFQQRTYFQSKANTLKFLFHLEKSQLHLQYQPIVVWVKWYKKRQKREKTNQWERWIHKCETVLSDFLDYWSCFLLRASALKRQHVNTKPTTWRITHISVAFLSEDEPTILNICLVRVLCMYVYVCMKGSHLKSADSERCDLHNAQLRFDVIDLKFKSFKVSFSLSLLWLLWVDLLFSPIHSLSF